MAKKLNADDVVARLKEKNLELRDEFTTTSDKGKFRCLACGYEWETQINNCLSRGIYSTGCANCSNKLKHTNERIDKFIQDNKLNIIRLDDVVSSKLPIRFKCLVDGYEWPLRTHDLLTKKRGCPNCAGQAKLTNREVDKRLSERNIKIQRLEDVVNSKKKIKWKYLIDDYEWYASPSWIFKGSGKCPTCNNSALWTDARIDEKFNKESIFRLDNFEHRFTDMEWYCKKCKSVFTKTLANLLNSGCSCDSPHKAENFIKELLFKHVNFDVFHTHKTFKANDRSYIVDFYFESKGKRIIVEYHYIQHYQPIEYFGGVEKFEIQIKRDNEVREYCKDNDIFLLEIPYDAEDKESFILENLSEFVKCDSDEQ